MKIAPLADVKARLSAYVDECETEGPVDDDLERLILARSPRLQALLAQSRQSIQAGRGLSQKEFWDRVKGRHR